jgi:MSHA biogenesis protein MshO
MRQRRSECAPVRARGFTLVEMVVAITLLGILAAAAVPMLRSPMVSYAQTALRADLGAQMEAATIKLRSDLAQAMPHSVRTRQAGARWYLEYMELRAYGRYRGGADTSVAQNCPATCAMPNWNDVLEFNSCSESCFMTLGPLQNVQAAAPVPGSDYVVIDPRGPGVAGFDPYEGGAAAAPGSVRTRLQGVATLAGGSRITTTPYVFTNPAPRASRQVYIVATPVTYECNPATQRLTRYWGYAITPVQPVAFGAAVSRAPLATNVADCRFRYWATGAGRGGVASMWLRFTRRSVGMGFEESVESLSEFSVQEPV